jgi:DNA-directed RNA polymerase subunit RPC12/RpoP
MTTAIADATLERCPTCRDKIVVRIAGEVLVRNAILRVNDGGGVTAKCSRCKTWVDVPLRYTG